MRRAVSVHTPGHWPMARMAGSVTLAFDERYRRRFRMTDDAGGDFLLDLADATLLRDGDGLELEDGGFVMVRAADEPVADIYGKTMRETARIAWHIGNRHTPLEVLSTGALRIIQDHVLIDMVEKLGAKVVRHKAPFTPEAGAYGGGHADGGHHHHDHGNGHHHDH